MKLLTTVVFLLLLFPVFAQKKTWMDSEGNKTSQKNASSYRIVTLQKIPNSKTGKLDELYLVEDFFLSGELRSTGNYSTKSLTKQEGVFTTYRKNGTKINETSYFHGLKHGKEYYYYDNGMLSSETNYVQSKAEGDAFGYYDDGAKRSEVHYTNGKTEGECRWYFQNGQLSSREVYAADTLLSFEIYFEDGTRDTLSKDVRVDGEFPGGVDAMRRFLKDNLRYPRAALDKGISGKVQVQFVVTEKGKISNVKIKRSAHDLLSSEAIRIVESMPDWTPTRIHGLPVMAAFNLPISFKL